MQREFRPKLDSGAILWDGFGLQSLHSGVGRHAWDLFRSLEKTACSPRIIPSVPQLDPQFQSQSLSGKTFWPVSRLKPWSLFLSGRWLKAYLQSHSGPCIIHGLSNYNLPALVSPRLRKVLTVHDLIPILHRQEVSKALGLYLNYQLPRAVDAADAIICVSQWTENALHERYPSSRGKTLIIPNGWPAYTQSPKTSPDEIPRLLTVSRMESYKRLDMIPKILGHLPENLQWTVVTDARGHEILKDFQDPRLLLRTNLRDDELLDLHQSAEVYVHPSLWEGFCLPAADSISCGVPVVHTLGSGIDEVVQGAGLGFAAHAEAKDWAAGISKLLAVPDRSRLCWERHRTAPSWDDVAARTRALYDKLGER